MAKAPKQMLNRLIKAGETAQRQLDKNAGNLPLFGDTDFVCISHRSNNCIRIIHETDEVHKMARRIFV